jgi:hypothetical protein
VLDGANRHDIKLLERTLQSIITTHPEGMNICLDAGYVGGEQIVEKQGSKAHIRGRGGPTAVWPAGAKRPPPGGGGKWGRARKRILSMKRGGG